MRWKRRAQGFSLIEVVVAFCLLAFVLTAGISIFSWQKQRMYEQTLWRRALEAMEEEVEARRASDPSMIWFGENQRWLLMPEHLPSAMPVSMRFLPNPVAVAATKPFQGDEGLAEITLTLSWGEAGGPRKTHTNTLVMLTR